jgi:F-type H+-transporting ATPase subunit gamma
VTGRLAAVEEHIAGVVQLGTVVGAMRGVAAARVQQARQVVEGVRSWTAIIEAALAEAVALLPADGAATRRRGHEVLVLLTAEHGFVGTLPERMLDAAAPDLSAGAVLYCLGSRGAALAEARGWQPAWSSPLATQIGAATTVASRVAETLYAAFLGGETARVDVLFPVVGAEGAVSPRRRPLLPLALDRFRRPGALERPLTYLPPARLVELLVGEYVMAELARAALEAFAAENAERLRTMEAARTNIDRRIDTLRGEERRARQEAITDELLDVLIGTLGAGPGAKGAGTAGDAAR